jgi:uncharacterized cupin superfamily protein
MVDEAVLEERPAGLMPVTPGWFVVDVRKAAWVTNETFGAACVFEGDAAPFPQLGYTIAVLQPGQPSGMYHSETCQEDFLVLQGECLLLVEGEERPLKPWDFVHCPPGTEHIFVGAGDGPCVIFMSGARSESNTITYQRNDVALRHGAGVETETQTPREAYVSFPKWKDGPPDSWDGLPWSDG